MRLTQEQAVAVAAAALHRSHVGTADSRDACLLDILDQLRDTTARAEQAERDADEMDRKMCVLVLEKQQAEKDRDAAWAAAWDAAWAAAGAAAWDAAKKTLQPTVDELHHGAIALMQRMVELPRCEAAGSKETP